MNLICGPRSPKEETKKEQNCVGQEKNATATFFNKGRIKKYKSRKWHPAVSHQQQLHRHKQLCDNNNNIPLVLCVHVPSHRVHGLNIRHYRIFGGDSEIDFLNEVSNTLLNLLESYDYKNCQTLITCPIYLPHL